MNKNFWYAVATIVGSTVGIGLYGIPFVFEKAGFGIGLLFLIGASGLITLVNLFYGEVILRTHERHQFVGYINKYLGPIARRLSILTFFIASYGALIGVIIISSAFLINILSPYFHLITLTASVIFIVGASALVFFDLRTVSKFDFFIMLLMGIIITMIAASGIKHITWNNYSFAIRDYWFLPFGVVIFALSGMPGVPLAKEVLAGREKQLKKAVLVGTFLPALIYLIFTFIVVGVSGENTTPDAISGLAQPLGQGIVLIGSLFGFLTSSTIFLNMATSLKKSLHEDFHFGYRPAWLLTVLPPYILFLAGVRNFIDIIGMAGGAAISIEIVLLILLYAKAKKNGDRIPEYSINLPKTLLYLIIVVLVFTMIYTLIR
jgi:tyrosine-specific transport protein